ncbi:hypothetical protein D2N39_20640 [Gemmobacter lutimaris]|uniref:Uncharacterized protein n=1 Tax=Gemmobacter lutimaris TaxID=2306023 RepID=A0A398BJN1_9RHOB|nr:hypothetical protein [Gemmobacter lutimaris]RID89884.1 hypothetical protein D2N39_20640 [Gemmobacter lutimaris]
MKKLLATTALAVIAMSGAASAQSVLERVLSSINVDNTNMLPVTGTFANIAENIAVLQPTTSTVYTKTDGSVISAADYEALKASEAYETFATGSLYYNSTTGEYVTKAQYDAMTTAAAAGFAATTAAVYLKADGTYVTTTPTTTYSTYTAKVIDGPAQILNNIDGSITNTMTGIQDATASVGTDVLAFSEVQVDIGDLSTTVLGAVNTGDITLGVNQDVSEAISGTSSAVSASINQLGGVTDQTALVLNVASNATDVIGSVNNSFTSLNGSIGNVATTVLGAVNTGTITSGINAAVTGVQSGIIGTN